MTTRLAMRLALCLILFPLLDGALGGAVRSARAETDLRWQWRQGQRLRASFTQTIENTTTVNKRPIQMDIGLRMFLRWDVLEVDSDGNAVSVAPENIVNDTGTQTALIQSSGYFGWLAQYLVQ